MKRTTLFLVISVFCATAIAGDDYALVRDPLQWVTEGRVPGYSYVTGFGINPEITDVSIPEDIWEGGGEYQYSAYATLPDVGVADIVSISSSNALDTQPTLVICLDDEGYEIQQVAILQGQTRVVLGTPCWRVRRAENLGSTKYNGTVYIYSGTESTAGVPSGASVVKNIIVDGKNQSEMTMITVPRDKVAFLERAEVGLGFDGLPSSGSKQVTFQFRVRSYRNVFKVKKEVYLITTGNTTHADVRPFRDPIPALSDITFTVTETTADVKVWGTYHLLLIDDNLLPPALLASIN
jgi:hypothetical protein